MRSFTRSADGRHLAAIRIAAYGTWLAIVARVDPGLFADLPSEVARPVGVMHLLPLEDLVSSPTAISIVRVVALVGCVLCVLGVRPFEPIALTTVGSLVVLDGSMKALGGYANHAQVPVLLIALAVACFPAADRWSVLASYRERSSKAALYQVPVIASALILTVTYSFVGLRRLVRGGPAVFEPDTVEVWLVAQSRQWSEWGVPHGDLVLAHRWLLPVAVTVVTLTTALEIVSPAVLRAVPLRLVWLPSMVAFHVATMTMMGIFFWESTILLLVIIGPWWLCDLLDLLDRTFGTDSSRVRSRSLR
jgi:hypothetical protein